jgi:hypothetical protein
MNYGGYLFGMKVGVTTPLAPAEAARRLDAAMASPFTSVTGKAVGWVRKGRVHLWYRRSKLNNAVPVLSGPIEGDGTGSRLALLYRAPLFFRLFFLFWTCAIIAVAAFVLPGASARLPLALVFAVMLAGPGLVVLIGKSGADADLDWLRGFLADTIDGSMQIG